MFYTNGSADMNVKGSCYQAESFIFANVLKGCIGKMKVIRHNIGDYHKLDENVNIISLEHPNLGEKDAII